MHRRAYALLIATAGIMGILALVTAQVLDRRLVDPEGFLGPGWLRLPMLLLGAFALDLVPRMLWLSRLNPKLMSGIVKERIRTHWTRDRIVLVVLGLVCFYLTYVSYRNLKSFLPAVMGPKKYDKELHEIDIWLFFGHEPAVVLHDLLGTTFTAHVLSSIYLWYLPMVGIAVAAWLVWSRNISFGYWFATSQCLGWALGTASYYMLPTLGPGFEYPWLYGDLAASGAGSLMDALFYGRSTVLYGDVESAMNSVAGFASLHTAITLLWALMAQYTIRNRVVHWILWINFALTIVATLYFGWHYVLDDVGGVAIALIAFYLGAWASGQRFHRGGFSSYPTTTTASVPVDRD
ncbi:phosphatase PAP2 family protein [Nocardioides limicola]|uniref:phosphatase PAP2 family protein n=1 Tax=Nocardioides limicola TaxID=2803368 RepID=UPI0027DD2681|nr:phosphatase PAP2 family protein [Nocardioides sp. DJM-14]